MRWLTLLFLIAAVPVSAQTVGPRGDRYELRVAKPKAEVYAAALGVLADSSFQINESSLDGGLIRTGWSKPGDTQTKGLGGALKSALREPVRIMLLIIPIAGDSTRVTITGDINMERIERTMKISTGDKGNWRILKGVGDAILEALK